MYGKSKTVSFVGNLEAMTTILLKRLLASTNGYKKILAMLKIISSPNRVTTYLPEPTIPSYLLHLIFTNSLSFPPPRVIVLKHTTNHDSIHAVFLHLLVPCHAI